MQKLLLPDHLEDTPTLRAIVVFTHYGVATSYSKCPKCGSKAKLEVHADRGWSSYRYSCSAVGHKHLQQPVNTHGFLQGVPINSWMPFLNTIVLLRLGRPWTEVLTEVPAAWAANLNEKTMRAWRVLYQQSLGTALDAMDLRIIGGVNHTVVVDECVIGIHGGDDGWSFQAKGISKGGKNNRRKTPQGRTVKLVRKKVLKRGPARTHYRTQSVQKDSYQLMTKKPAAATAIAKKPAAAMKPIANLKTHGKWLWVGVVVGKGNTVFTHDNGLKRMTYRLLPKKSEAKYHRPRGLSEIKDTLVALVRFS